jgi:hypothetical protein
LVYYTTFQLDQLVSSRSAGKNTQSDTRRNFTLPPPREFAWFAKVFLKKQLTISSDSQYETEHRTGKTLEQFLLNAPSDLYYENERW